MNFTGFRDTADSQFSLKTVSLKTVCQFEDSQFEAFRALMGSQAAAEFLTLH